MVTLSYQQQKIVFTIDSEMTELFYQKLYLISLFQRFDVKNKSNYDFGYYKIDFIRYDTVSLIGGKLLITRRFNWNWGEK